MNIRRQPFAFPMGVGIAMLAGFVALVLFASTRPSAAAPHGPGTALSGEDASLLDGYRHVEVASVSDAMEKVTGKKSYMSHHMRPIFPAKFAGFAVTVDDYAARLSPEVARRFGLDRAENIYRCVKP